MSVEALDMDMKWYCLQVAFSRVPKFMLEVEKLRQEEYGFKLGEVLSPTEEVVEQRRGKRKESSRPFFPNYVFIEMMMEENTYNKIKSLPMVRGFIGGTTSRISGWQAPVSIDTDEINRIRERVREGALKPKPKIEFHKGDTVRIKEGPFTNYPGIVGDVNYETSRITVTVTVFSRPTDIQTDFENVEKT